MIDAGKEDRSTELLAEKLVLELPHAKSVAYSILAKVLGLDAGVLGRAVDEIVVPLLTSREPDQPRPPSSTVAMAAGAAANAIPNHLLGVVLLADPNDGVFGFGVRRLSPPMVVEVLQAGAESMQAAITPDGKLPGKESTPSRGEPTSN